MDNDTTLTEKTLWKNWDATKDPEIANQLVNHYKYLVSFHVDRIGSTLPRNVEHDDLKSLGLMGLFDAIKKFEIDRGLKFETYASFRIRGSIIDGLRREDWLPRSHRERIKEIEAVSESLEQELKRQPTAKEIAKQLNISSKEVETLMRDTLVANVLSIEEQLYANDDYSEGIKYSIENTKTILPEEELVNKELEEDLVKGIKQLNENEQLVITLFYNEELTMTEIGNVLNLTTSRISQIHKSALFKLKDILKRIN